MNFKTLFFSTLLYASVLSWWEVGHMIVAQVAFLDLQQNNPDVLARASALVESLNSLCDARSQNFIESAPWADDIKGQAMSFLDNWHFYDRPLNPTGIYAIQDTIQSQFQIVDALKRSQYALQGDDGKTNTFTKAMFIRYIIHLIGDIHQPLHSTTFFNATYQPPTGDMGGNLINVTLMDGTKVNLHSYFDSGCFSFQGLNDDTYQRPLNKEDQNSLKQTASNFMQQYSRNSFQKELTLKDPNDWSKESYQLAKNQIYPYLQNNNVIDDQYNQENILMVSKQVTKGGYRLADFLTDLLKPTPQNENKNLRQM